MTNFHFLRPWWLLALPALAALLWTLRRRQRGGGDWREFCDPALLPHMLIGTPERQTRLPPWLAALAGTLAVLALAGPAWERLPAPVFRNLSALVVTLDLSMAMNAADLKPNRLERARFKINDILRERKDGQTALVVYAGDAFAVTPVTDDSATITAQLTALSPGLMPAQGSRVDLGLAAAGRLLKQAGLKTGDVLLISSGEGAAGAEAAAAGLRSQGYRVSVLGAGTSDGAPVPLPEGGFLKDPRGNILVPRMDTAALERVAVAGGGLYRALGSDSSDLDALSRFFDRPAESAEPTGDTVRIERWRESGVYLLPILLPLAALAFRRGWLGIWLLLALAPFPEPARALEWQDLWLTPDQRAQREFSAGQPDQAAQHFRNPEWKATAEYKAGQYELAAKALEKLDSSTSQYNRGNALANQGQYEQAIQAYKQALKLDPSNQDAEYNKKLVEEALRKQKEEQKKQKQDQKEGKDNQEPQERKDKDNQGQKQESNPGEQGSESSPKQGKENQGQQEQPRENGQSGKPRENHRDGESRDPKQGENSDAAEQSESPSSPGGKEREPKPEPAEPGQSPKPSEQQPGLAQQPGDRETQPLEAESEAKDETRQAEEQWLRRIPDDPGGLLKRKFYYQYRQRQQQQDSEREPW